VFEIGTSLREARLRQGLDFAEIEQATKIRGKYLRALEAEEFELLPAQTYVKGFLRSYAEFLGLDGQLYVDEFNSRFVKSEEDLPFRPRRHSRVPRRRRGGLESSAVLGAIVGIAVVTALVIAAWRFGGGSEDRGARPSTGLRAPQPARSELVVRASAGASRLEVHVRSSAGRQLFRGTVERGRAQRFLVSKRLWVWIERPGNVQVRLNGKRASLPARRSVRLFVTPRRIAAAPATS
jgi:cytoskeleton protein RodZ